MGTSLSTVRTSISTSRDLPAAEPAKFLRDCRTDSCPRSAYPLSSCPPKWFSFLPDFHQRFSLARFSAVRPKNILSLTLIHSNSSLNFVPQRNRAKDPSGKTPLSGPSHVRKVPSLAPTQNLAQIVYRSQFQRGLSQPVRHVRAKGR